MDKELFARYFNAPIIEVEGRVHKVEVNVYNYSKVVYCPCLNTDVLVDMAKQFVEEFIIRPIRAKTY
jgi:HrpA-like RNA helicase